MTLLSDILSSRARAEIFRLLFGLVKRDLHVREIERRSGLTIGTVRQELQKLERLDLVVSRRDGNRLYYRANTGHLLYADVHSMVLKTAGLGERLRQALGTEDIPIAFVFGSIAQGSEDARSDVDLMVICNLGLRELSRRLSGVSEEVGREINPFAMRPDDFKERFEKGEHFITQVLASPKLFIVGSEDELVAMAGERLASAP